ncbi:MAG: DUF87 domain-containing protein [Candidatus Aenigmatarchaeota archaeon]
MNLLDQEKLISNEINKLVPVLGKTTAERLEKAYLLGDENIRKRIVELIDITKAAVFSDNDLRDSVLMEPLERDKAIRGDLNLGRVLYGRKNLYPFSLEINQLLTHVGIFGSSGYGKTNISYCMIKELSDKNIPVIVFDFSKRNYRGLLATDLKNRIDIYTIGRDVAPFKFNPLKQPNGIELSQWIKEFSSIFDHAYWLLGGGTHIILKALVEIYQNNKNPKLSDLKKWLEEYLNTATTSREKNWLSTAQRPLESLCMKSVNEIFDCEVGIKPSEFFKPGKITILELDALSTNDKTFFIEIILQWIRDWLLVNNSREELFGVIILEEAHHILNREKAKKLGSETVIDLIFREVRELGLGIVYIDQHPSLVSYPALGNTSTHIYMNLGLDTKHSSDILDASNMLGLDYEEEGKYLRQLPVGHGFVLMRRSEFPHPFLVKFNKFKINKEAVTDDDIMLHMKSKIKFEEKQKIEFPSESIDENSWRIINAIGSGKGVSTSEIYRALRMSGSVFSECVKKLIKSGIVDFKEIKIKNSKACFYFLTDVGEKLFEKKFGGNQNIVSFDIKPILHMFSLAGWSIESINNNTYTLTNSENKIELIFVFSPDRDKIFKDIRDGYYYITATESIANIVIQQATRHAKNSKIRIQIATVDEFEKNYGFRSLQL